MLSHELSIGDRSDEQGYIIGKVRDVKTYQIHQIKRQKVYCLLESEEGFDLIVRFGISRELKSIS